MVHRVKTKTVFVCQNCGYSSPRWAGKCPNCDTWNSMAEEKPPIESGKGTVRKHIESKPVRLREVQVEQLDRVSSHSKEFDRVVGGGLVPGSLVLIGGDPGIGKSTLLLQQMTDYANSGKKVLCVAGEESMQQVRMRSLRLGLNPENLWIFAEIDVQDVISQIETLEPDIVVVDSIQTMFHPDYESAPGSVTQVRESTQALFQIAKTRDCSILLIGHVTKEGAIAGPRVLEHIVDVLLFLEGDRQYQYRILRGIKNRFGSTNEIGVFELTEHGMIEVDNPSQLFLSDHRESISGSAVTCALEGTRPIVLEVQALTATASFGMPQRTATGMDQKRLSLLLAILEKRAGFSVGQFDVFVKIVGGLRLDDPSADLATLVAIAASSKNVVIDAASIFIGEVGLGGEVRTVAHLENRLKEADQLGFRTAYIPKSKQNNFKLKNLAIIQIDTIQKMLKNIL